jgi:hypothetical protein
MQDHSDGVPIPDVTHLFDPAALFESAPSEDDYLAQHDEQGPADAVHCPRHGEVRYVQPDSEEEAQATFQTWTGFAGGKCYAAKLTCGCWDADESDDVRAAE